MRSLQLPMILLMGACRSTIKPVDFQVTIQEPLTDTEVFEHDNIQFVGTVLYQTGDEVSDVHVQWASSLDALLFEEDIAGPVVDGVLNFESDSLQPGIHDIFLNITDSQGAVWSDQISLMVVDVAEKPSVEILTPEEGFIEVGEEAYFSALVSDLQDAPEDLLLSIESTLDGLLCEVHPEMIESDSIGGCAATLSLGQHRIYFTVVDLDGDQNRAQMDFSVLVATQIDHDGDGFSAEDGDCNDEDVSISPNGLEIINDIDDDCNGVIDDHTSIYDDDGDCYCEEAPCIGSWSNCDSIEGGDCDDEVFEYHPFADEYCDFLDNDCDGEIDENTAVDAPSWYEDSDGDGYGNPNTAVFSCQMLSGLVANGDDCNDADPSINPAISETVNGVDDDCNTLIDDQTNVYDDDGDGFTEDGGDCNDADPNTYPNATEIPNGLDENCNGLIDDQTNVYDDDGDGFAENQGDCDDGNPNIYPNTLEICGNGVDDNCNGTENEQNAVDCIDFFRDNDGDGYGAGTPECWCEPGGSNALYTASLSGDCQDNRPNVHPGQTSYFQVDRGDGSFDYDCDNVESKEFNSEGSCSYWVFWCSLGDAGWVGNVPNCGASGYFLESSSNCNVSGLGCAENGVFPYYQKCR